MITLPEAFEQEMKRLLGEEECLRLRDWLSSGKKEA